MRMNSEKVLRIIGKRHYSQESSF